ncbi:CoA-transferase family III [Thelephora ganbajun]|uniref:CoA-transferase family III n=1 Tax=Thelephora ganbajun TaxID=370292 RepID=A0ACB6Z5T4_THEGA|nr:CoA-transferase family III [Thelephora ganbajun]
MSALPLAGVTVIEFAGLAPGPYAGQVLQDWGARVIRVDRVEGTNSIPDFFVRGKRSIAVNPKVPSGLNLLKRMIRQSDVLIDPFRPGVMERLGLGPDVFLGEDGLNDGLVYARLSGFPPKGPYKDMAGHDINYLALSGVLSMLPGSSEKPAFPLNIMADFAGGGMMCVFGVLLALFERATKSGKGQVVDIDMVSGTRYISLFPLVHADQGSGSQLFSRPRGKNLLDGGAPFYDVYVCSDGCWMSVGCIEPQFFKTFIDRFIKGLDKDFPLKWRPSPETQANQEEWPELRKFLVDGFRSNTREHWTEVFHNTDSCAVPVLFPSEAAKLSSEEASLPQPSLSRTYPRKAAELTGRPPFLPTGQHTEEILDEFGIVASEKVVLMAEGALGTKRSKL